MTDAPRDPRLFALTAAAARDAIEVVRSIQGGDGFILNYLEYPHLSWFDSGLPHLSTYRSENVPHYRDAYRRGSGDSKRVDFAELESFKQLQNYCLQSDRIRSRFVHGRKAKDVRERFVRISADLLAEQLMERFLHLHDKAEVTDTLLLPIYLPLEAPVLEDELKFDVVVPIVVMHFPDVTEKTIVESVTLRRLSDQEHLARWPLGPSTTESVNATVLSAATHAFVLTGHTVPANKWAERYSDAIDMPWRQIDLAFDALRVVTGARTGYAQVLVDPKGWADDYVADLPPLIRGPQVRRYPESLEKWGWMNKGSSVELPQLPEVGETLRVLSEDSHLQMAARRFSSSLLGSDEDDAVVDLCTCLEIMLTDDTKTEIRHKLRLRAAAVIAESYPGVDARVVFDGMDDVYNLRSFVLHGSKSTKKKKDLHKMKWGSGELQTVDVARWIAQTVLQWTIRRGQLVAATQIDRELILDALTQSPTPSDDDDSS